MIETRPRPSRGRRTALSVAVLTIAGLVATACAGQQNAGGNGGSGGGAVLRTAWSTQDVAPDPATFQGFVGTELMTALYEGLVQYAPTSATIEPQLATSWNTSADGLTYTFHLRHDAVFHDGTPVNAQAVAYSFDRLRKINLGYASLLSDVSSLTAVDAYTVVFHLSKPDPTLLQTLASPFGLKIVSPALVNAHLGTDNGQKYLATHDAGSGPYELDSYLLNQSITISAFPKWWNPHKPHFTQVQITITPSIQTEVLELQKGQLDFLSYAIPSNDLEQLASDSNLKIDTFPTLNRSELFINPHGAFSSLTVRDALVKAINRSAINAQAFGPYSKLAATFTLPGLLPAGQGADSPPYDPSALKALVPSMRTKKVTIGVLSGAAPETLAADLIQTELQAVGLNATVENLQDSQFFGFTTANPATVPDLLVITSNAPTAAPSSFVQDFMTSQGTLNFQSASVPAANQLLQQAATAPSTAAFNSDVEQAVNLLIRYRAWLGLSDQQTVIVHDKRVSSVGTNFNDPYGVNFATTS
jgi:peptide/nickel transport system substrate-binding protein